MNPFIASRMDRRLHSRKLKFLITIASLAFHPASSPAALPEAPAEEVGLDPARLDRIDEAVARAIEKGQVPGAVVVVGRGGKIAYAKAFGLRASDPADEPMTRETSFDLASLTKPIATATSVMILIEQGKLRLDDPVARHWPEFASRGKGVITVEQLLRHRSGLIADNPLADYADGPAVAWERIADLGLVGVPGARFTYSDVNYLILGKLVERVSDEPLDEFARRNLFEPLGMGSTFRPASAARIAPTVREGGAMLRGVVHDPRSRALGGVAGHAGLFGTADDLAIYAQMLLDGGKGSDGRRVLGPAMVKAMIEPGTTPPGQARGLGWDLDTPYSRTPRGSGFGRTSFGHTGFTGTSLWVDPDSGTFVILLTSYLHPAGSKGRAIGPLRSEVASAAAAAIRPR